MLTIVSATSERYRNECTLFKRICILRRSICSVLYCTFISHDIFSHFQIKITIKSLLMPHFNYDIPSENVISFVLPLRKLKKCVTKLCMDSFNAKISWNCNKTVQYLLINEPENAKKRNLHWHFINASIDLRYSDESIENQWKKKYEFRFGEFNFYNYSWIPFIRTFHITN